MYIFLLESGLSDGFNIFNIPLPRDFKNNYSTTTLQNLMEILQLSAECELHWPKLVIIQHYQVSQLIFINMIGWHCQMTSTIDSSLLRQVTNHYRVHYSIWSIYSMEFIYYQICMLPFPVHVTYPYLVGVYMKDHRRYVELYTVLSTKAIDLQLQNKYCNLDVCDEEANIRATTWKNVYYVTVNNKDTFG